MRASRRSLGITSAAFTIALALAFGGTAVTANTDADMLREQCPNPAPWWCSDGEESDRCPDGDLDWRGCVEDIIIE
jgi:hypothetical protein